MKQIEEWIDNRLIPYMTRKTINYSISSYGLKHVAERELGFYISNDTMKELLHQKGVYGVTVGPNECYPLSAKWKQS